jgi:hypothetical protein
MVDPFSCPWALKSAEGKEVGGERALARELVVGFEGVPVRCGRSGDGVVWGWVVAICDAGRRVDTGPVKDGVSGLVVVFVVVLALGVAEEVDIRFEAVLLGVV